MTNLPTAAEIEALGSTPGLPDEVFENDGLITKRHQRATAFAFLRPACSQLMWDVGTGSGAMAIEWVRAANQTRAIGVERDPQRAARARRNVARLAPDRVEIMEGDALNLLDSLPDPDAIFIGGGASREVIAKCWARLSAGGRIVVHAVTVETEVVLAEAFKKCGGQLSRISVEVSAPIGRLTGMSPYRTVTQWAGEK